MSEGLYEAPGYAHFMCPQLAEWLGHRPWHVLSQQERAAHSAALERHGHSEYFFFWRRGAHHIDFTGSGEIHPETGRPQVGNGGVPACVLCGQRLVLVDGDDPTTAPTVGPQPRQIGPPITGLDDPRLTNPLHCGCKAGQVHTCQA